MQRKFVEQLTLVASVTKWTAYATIVGILVGLGTSAFLESLAWTTKMFGSNANYFYFLPLALVGSSFLVHWLAPDAEGHGTEKVIEAVHKRMGRIAFRVVPVKLAATVLTLAVGGSAGKEGPCAQIGAGLASAFGGLLRLDDVDRRKLVICGISAGFATVFGTPIAGALFGVEVLVLGQLLYDVLFPSFVAGVVGYHVATLLGVQYSREAAPFIPQMTGISMLEMILLGMWCGLVALFLIESMKFAHMAFARLNWHYSLKALLGGGLLVLIGAFLSPSYLGLGLDTIDQGLRGNLLPVGSVFWKGIATSITLGCGGSGGVVTPIFYIGTAAGNLLARLLHEPTAAFSAIGMVALLAGAANTPIAASVMAIELFGSAIAPNAAVACMVSFLIVGYRSIYPSQVLGMQKSTSLKVSTGKTLAEFDHADMDRRSTSLLGFIEKGVNKVHHVKKGTRQDKHDG